jgi:hypothetical protein
MSTYRRTKGGGEGCRAYGKKRGYYRGVTRVLQYQQLTSEKRSCPQVVARTRCSGSREQRAEGKRQEARTRN